MIKLQDICWKISESCRKVFGSFDKTAFYLSTVDFKEKYYSCVKCCLVRIFGARVKKCQVIWVTVPARVYELLSTSTKKSVSFHFDEKTFFSKVFVIYEKFSDSKHNISSFSPLNFLAGLLKQNLGVERNISWRKPTWNNLFSETFFFGFWTKSTRTFHKKFLADFEKTVLRVQRNSLWKSMRQKRSLQTKLFPGTCFDNFRTFGGIFPAVLSKLYSSFE